MGGGGNIKITSVIHSPNFIFTELDFGLPEEKMKLHPNFQL